MASGGSSVYKGSDQFHNYSCSTCEQNYLNSDAHHFCPQCEHYLCDKCVNIHGEYFKKHVVYGRGDIQQWAVFSMERCDQHGKVLEFHCDGHHEFCCSVCLTLNHRHCSRISPLPDLSRGFMKTAEFKQLPSAVYKMRQRMDELKNDRIKDQVSLKDSYKNIIAEIKAIRKEINHILNELEKKTFEQLDSMMEDLGKGVKHDIETCAHMHDQLKTMFEKLRKITGKNKETSSYIGFRICQSKLSEAKFLEQELLAKGGMKFKSDESVLPFLRNLNRLGNVETDNIHVYKAQSSSRYKVRIKKDKTICLIAGICELPSGEVVIADRHNKRVKLLNRQFEVIDHCDLPSHPYHLCHTTGSEVAVAVTYYTNIPCEVHFLTVTRGKLQAVRKFTTNHYCYSIAHHQGKLYVGSAEVLYLYAMDGRLIKKLYANDPPYSTVCRYAVSPDGKRIYVTNPNDSELITLDEYGQVLSTVEDPDIHSTGGLCVSPSGHVFVCGYGSHTVLQVDQEGRKKLATVAREADGLCKPRSVWFSEQTSTLIVGNYEKDKIIVVKLC